MYRSPITLFVPVPRLQYTPLSAILYHTVRSWSNVPRLIVAFSAHSVVEQEPMEGTQNLDEVSLNPHLKLFLSGPPGAGKTTLAVNRLRWLIEQHTPDTSILVLLPQRLLASPFYAVIRDPDLGPAIPVDILTFDGLARRILSLFWPLMGDRAGFAFPDHSPVFLTVESAQFFMRLLVDPLIDEAGYFSTVTIERSRLVSQLLDDLNKAALIGISLDEAFERLMSSWSGESAHLQMFVHARECVQRFREFCLSHNLLDFSLQIDVFSHHLFVQPAVKAYLFERYRHLIVDNVEEDTPVLHDLLLDWIPHCQSALLIQDLEGGHRIFLGADPASAGRLSRACDQHIRLSRTYVASTDILDFADQIGVGLGHRPSEGGISLSSTERGDFRHSVHLPPELKYHHQMLDWVVQQIDELVNEKHASPGEIVIVSPFVGDALRFSLLTKLAAAGIPATSHRASRALRDEPPVRCLLTLARIAHPWWDDTPPKYDFVLALVEAIHSLDLVRAHLLAEVVYHPNRPGTLLSSFAEIEGPLRQRIKPVVGERYDTLRAWILDYQQGGPKEEVPLDVFLSRLLGEVLAQPGFGFHAHRESPAPPAREGAEANVDRTVAIAYALYPASELLSSVRKFRHEIESIPDLLLEGTPGAHILRMIEQGAIAATHMPGRQHRWQEQDEVVLAPAHTFLVSNRSVDYQFWLDVGSSSWWERIYQPLTHPYVLRRDWPLDRQWTDEDEYYVRQETLSRLVSGLAYRCRRAIFLASSSMNEQGYEQRGPLLQAVQAALKRAK